MRTAEDIDRHFELFDSESGEGPPSARSPRRRVTLSIPPRRMKFETVGFHPVDGCALNVVEQINQTWTYTVALAATKQLWTYIRMRAASDLRTGAGASQARQTSSAALTLAAGNPARAQPPLHAVNPCAIY